jgi:hypothetical protein
MARRAGRYGAARDTPPNNSVTIANVAGSDALTGSASPRPAMPELSGMSRMRSGQSTLDAWAAVPSDHFATMTANTRIGGSPFAWDGSFGDKNQ